MNGIDNHKLILHWLFKKIFKVDSHNNVLDGNLDNIC